MNIYSRVSKLEGHLHTGPDADGKCGYCRGREKELGSKHVVVHNSLRDPVRERLFPSKPHPGSTPCHRCGRDMNVTILVKHVDMIAQRNVEFCGAEKTYT